MALNIKSKEADTLARELASLTGETLTEAVTKSLKERLRREREAREADDDLPARLKDFAAEMRGRYDTRPVTRAEWDAARGEGDVGERISGHKA